MAGTKSSKGKGLASLILVLLLLAALFVVKQCSSGKADDPKKKTTTTKTTTDQKTTTDSPRGLDRNPAAIQYSKHARCRMDCRHISEAEVTDILKNGKINYKKSELGDLPDCKRKYAVEGDTKDGQKVRIIFAPCQSEVTVVTVIDLEKEWACECN